MYSIGIDAGSVATKGVIFDGEKIEHVIIPTGWSPKTASEEVLKQLLVKSNIKKEDVERIIGTGYGRISMPFVDKAITEITCHAKGAHYLNKKVRTILDIGGQDSKVINIDENGNITDFLMNDKCAAGTGRFLQVMANVLGKDVSELDDLTNNARPEAITSMCTVFAESEVISLLARGIPKENIASGIMHSIASRGVSLLERINILDDVAFTGGVARSDVIGRIINDKISKTIYKPPNSQIVGALGAAVIGYRELL
ncbi:MAG: 2-hydroxyglutaryl-CoA dehydratase [Firmicutes bacterium]|nr:2-hydroxyglutaryl-CoA dehydratase [Bacillota bacterium]